MAPRYCPVSMTWRAEPPDAASFMLIPAVCASLLIKSKYWLVILTPSMINTLEPCIGPEDWVLLWSLLGTLGLGCTPPEPSPVVSTLGYPELGPTPLGCAVPSCLSTLRRGLC